MFNSKLNTYAAFGGCDIAFFLDNKTIGEAQEVFINTEKRQIEIKAVVFNTLIGLSKEFISKDNSKLLIVFINEYGDKMYRVIDGIKFSHEKINYSVDKLIMHNSFIFDFEDMSLYKDFDSTVVELRSEIFKD